MWKHNRDFNLSYVDPYFMLLLFAAPQVIFHTGRWSPWGRSWERWGRGIWCGCTVANSWKAIIEAASTSLSADGRQTPWSFPGLRRCPPLHCGPCWDTLLRSVRITGSDTCYQKYALINIPFMTSRGQQCCAAHHMILELKKKTKCRKNEFGWKLKLE